MIGLLKYAIYFNMKNKYDCNVKKKCNELRKKADLRKNEIELFLAKWKTTSSETEGCKANILAANSKNSEGTADSSVQHKIINVRTGIHCIEWPKKKIS